MLVRSRSCFAPANRRGIFPSSLPEKVERIRDEFPDAATTSWSKAPQAIAALLKRPPATPAIVPERNYSGTPLPKKLGINADYQVALIAAPDGFDEALGDLPANVTFTPRLTPKTDLALCFIRSLDDLAATLDLLSLRLPKTASVWIIHPKRTGKHHVDFHQNHVRDAALVTGLVDYKVCSIDNYWSALKFAWRKKPLA